MSQVRVKDYTGKTIHKKKRGFTTKKEALEWERDFLNKANADMGMMFQDFVDLYFEDMGHRLKESTIISKRYMVDKKILPVFGKIPINEITPKDIRKWQNSLTAYRDKNGKPFAPTYLKTINNQLTAMFNYAVKYYDLRENPCTKAGSMGKSNAEEMQFWTKAEFEQFITAVQDKPASYTAFMTMYYTGMRVGFIFQSFQLVSELNVEQNIIFPLLLDYQKPDPKKVNEILNLLGLAERRYHLPRQLSGGQQQRVAIGRALITQPKLILADEPTGNLDSKNSQDVIDMLISASRHFKQTILMITHNNNLTSSVDRVFRVSDGILTDLGGTANEALS